MPFNPSLPAANSPMVSAEMRDQFNGLKDLIDESIPATEKAAPNGVASLDGAGNLVQPANFATLTNKPVPIADGTYTVGIGTVQNGTITVVDGIITGIQEASSTPPAQDFTGSGFGDAGYNTSYYENGTFNGHPAYSDTGGTHWIFWSTAYDGWALYSDLSDPSHVAYFKQPAAPANEVHGNYDPDDSPGPNGTIAAG